MNASISSMLQELLSGIRVIKAFATEKQETARFNKENARTRYALNRLTRAIEAIQLCPHRASCPVSGELRHDEDDQEGTEPGAKRTKRRQCKPKSESDGKPGEDNGDVVPADSERHGPVEHSDE